MEQKDQRLCITIDEMARQLGIGRTNAYKLAKDKSFYPAKRVCGRYVVSVSLLNKWINEQNK